MDKKERKIVSKSFRDGIIDRKKREKEKKREVRERVCRRGRERQLLKELEREN